MKTLKRKILKYIEALFNYLDEEKAACKLLIKELIAKGITNEKK